MSFLSSGYVPSPRRIAVIAGTTFIQLMRMKIFFFFLIFILIILALNSIRFSDFLGPETHGAAELILLKNSAFGAMRLFGLIFCVTATALLIPKDTEDRILYTILCKPVPMIDYIIGKALGVLFLASVTLLLMDLFTVGILYQRMGVVITEQINILKSSGAQADYIQSIVRGIQAQGPDWNLQAGMLVMLLEFAVLISITMLISCLTQGTLLSSLLAFGVYFVGVFQTQAKVLWFESSSSIGTSDWVLWASKAFSAIFPDFSLYSITDSAINGQLIPLPLLGHLALISLAYFLFHTMLSAWVFRKREF